MTSRIILEYDPDFPFCISDGKIEEEISDIISFQQCGNNIEHNITLTYDDQEIDLGKVNILVKSMESK